jgi:PAS domain S-box-containing protein
MKDGPMSGRSSPGLPGARSVEAKIIELVEQAIIVTDLDGVVTFMNPFAERLYGWNASDAVGRSVMEVNVPDLSQDQAIQILAELRAGKSWSGEFRVQRRDGTTFTAAVTDTPVRDEQGQLCAIIGVSSDITERKRAEESIDRNLARFRALADQAPVGVFETDADDRIVYLNDLGKRMLGPFPEAARGMAWHCSIHLEDRERVARQWHVAIAADEVFCGEFRFQHSAGRSVLIRGYGTALRDRSGRLTGSAGVLIDITESRALQIQIATASRLAAIGAIVAGAARAIEPPLSSSLPDRRASLEVARGARTRLMGDAPIDRSKEARVIDQMVKELEHSEQERHRISQIVQGLSMLAGSAPGRIRVRLYDLVNQALHWLPTAVARPDSVKLESQGTYEVNASAGQIEQVVVNLVSNAARATPSGKPGPIVVRIGSGMPGMVRLEVIDRGTGIEPATLARVFEPFFTTRSAGEGVGLGLAVSHAIVTAHGGTITVESAVGKGSIFRVELPVAPAVA